MFPVDGSDVPLPAWEFFDDELVDLHSGHWPQFSRVDDTAGLILEAAGHG